MGCRRGWGTRSAGQGCGDQWEDQQGTDRVLRVIATMDAWVMGEHKRTLHLGFLALVDQQPSSLNPIARFPSV